jgi:hypothetical protein
MFSGAPMQAPQGSSDPAALAAELVAGGPEAVMPFLEALDEALGEHDADLKRLVLAMDKGEKKAPQQDQQEESDVPMNPEQAAFSEQAAPGGRNRISMR